MRLTLRECTMTMRMSAKSFSVASTPHAACRCRLLAVSRSAWEHKVLGQDTYSRQEQSMLPANRAGCLQSAVHWCLQAATCCCCRLYIPYPFMNLHKACTRATCCC